ncbi:MAG: hypothetical protein CNLJKLNK_01011 [Holosporales bacterium]
MVVIVIHAFLMLVCASYALGQKVDLCQLEKALANVFVLRSGFLIPQEEVKQLADDGACSTYGEILPKSLESLFSLFPENWIEDAYFFDLGSGVGKTVIQAAFTFKKSIGVELSKTRHTHAQEGLKEFLVEYPQSPHLNVEFRQENMIKTSLDSSTHPALIFMCSTCFNSIDSAFMKKMVNHINTHENVHVVISLAELKFDDESFELLGIKKIPMTWGNAISAHIYARKTLDNETKDYVRNKLKE